jgi:integrase
MTVSELCDAYIGAAPTLLISRAGRAKKESTLATDKSRIEAHIKPLLGKQLVGEIAPADIETFLHRVASGDTKKERIKGRGNPPKGGKGTASRTVGLLGAIFTYAVKRKLRADNPVRGVVRFADKKKERRLSADEYKALGTGLAKAAADKMNPYGVAAMRFLALTGWRRGEAVNLKWSDVDAARRTITLGDTKSGRSLRPLATAALDAIKDLPRRAGNPYVFPATKGAGAISNLPRLFDVIRAKSELPDEITSHVLRHSFASLASDTGLSEATIAGLLGHKLGTITSRYVHSADAVMIRAADTVADSVLALMGDGAEPAQVIPLARLTA